MATSREMTEGRALPLIFNFTLPLLLGNLLQQTYSLVDAAIVGRFLEPFRYESLNQAKSES